MATPSILIVPDRYKSGVLYSQLPENGAVDFGVTRATPAFRTNASGVSESVASGVPRLDYPAAGGCPSLLVEPAATNLSLRSEEFTASGFWSLTNAIVSGNTAVAPDGTMTADTLTATAIGGQIQGTIVGVSGTTYIASFFIKRRTGTGVVNIRSVENVNTPITVTNNWTRVSLAATATSTNVRIGIHLATSGDAVDIWGAQLETGSVATSYIPTTTAAVTRNADVISKTGVSGFIGQTEGTLYAEVDLRSIAGVRTIMALSDGTGTTSNRIAVNLSTNQVSIACNFASGSTVLLNSALTLSGLNKIAVAYTGTTIDLIINGGSPISTTTGGFGNYSKIHLGINQGDASQLNDRIRAAAIYTTRLSNTDLAALTSL
jgi:hypothetical protein